MRCAVTGGTGFLGRHLTRALRQRGDSVRVLARRDDSELRRLGAQLVLGDLQDLDSLRDCFQATDCVFHTAALAGIWGKWRDFETVNVHGTANVLRICRELGVRRLVHTSSPSVTFRGGDQRNVDESAPYPVTWLCHYPRSKALAEQEVLRSHGRDGLATCALRPHLIWGPGDRHLIPRLIERARRGQLARVGDGRNRIDITYIDNAVDAHLLAADRLDLQGAVGGRTYFISQGEPVNCWDWIDDILRLAGLPPVRRVIPYRLARVVGAGLECVYFGLGRRDEPPMTRFLADQLARDHYFDISAARRDLGYQPQIDTAEGLIRLTEWLRAESDPGEAPVVSERSRMPPRDGETPGSRVPSPDGDATTA